MSVGSSRAAAPAGRDEAPRADLLDSEADPSGEALDALMQAFRNAVRAKSKALDDQVRQRIAAAAVLGAERAAALRASPAGTEPEREPF